MPPSHEVIAALMQLLDLRLIAICFLEVVGLVRCSEDVLVNVPYTATLYNFGV
jgi:hypothetical protein